MRLRACVYYAGTGKFVGGHEIIQSRVKCTNRVSTDGAYCLFTHSQNILFRVDRAFYC